MYGSKKSAGAMVFMTSETREILARTEHDRCGIVNHRFCV
jgi:hypothetical protein